MIWSQVVAGGELKKIGDGIWSGDTFKASVIEIGEHSMRNIRVAKCLLDHMEAGRKMELLICSAHIYGVKVGDETYREGAARQMGWALIVAMVSGWVFLPLAIIAFVFIRRAYAIYSF